MTDNGPLKTKTLRKEINQSLSESLGKLKDILGEKEFNSRTKKATKLLTLKLDKKIFKKTAGKTVKSKIEKTEQKGKKVASAKKGSPKKEAEVQ